MKTFSVHSDFHVLIDADTKEQAEEIADNIIGAVLDCTCAQHAKEDKAGDLEFDKVEAYELPSQEEVQS
jgi:hypothetical protein